MALTSTTSISVIVVVFSSLVAVSYSCPKGCTCRGISADKPDTAVCMKPWETDAPPKFPRSIETIEFRELAFRDMKPYLYALPWITTLRVYPADIPRNKNYVPPMLFSKSLRMKHMEIHTMNDGYVPGGMAEAFRPLYNLATLDLMRNKFFCDCAFPHMIGLRRVRLISMDRSPPVTGCLEKFKTSILFIRNLREACGKLAGYIIGDLYEPDPDPVEAAGKTLPPPPLPARKTSNVRDKDLFDKGVSYNRINAKVEAPKSHKSAPVAFAGKVGGSPSGEMAAPSARQKPVLLAGRNGNGARAKPNSQSRMWGRGRGRGKGKGRGKRRKRRNGKGKKRTKRQVPDGDTDDVTEREDGSVPEGHSLQDSPTHGNGTAHHIAEDNRPTHPGNQEVIHQDTNTQNLHDDPINLVDYNENDHQADVIGAHWNIQDERIGPRPAMNDRAQYRHNDHHNSFLGDRRRHHLQQLAAHNANEQAERQLAIYQLPMNDLTVKLNPYDPFEVDLFFQYILHNEKLPGYPRTFPRTFPRT